ncbi:beta-1,4-galactosyltransferase 4-like [Scleropages formosus]|uniref:Beta-1,4-galactosyltransferase n=1 Tax=Scleropages formosus TaxID=113540 RepID=A0A0P7UZV7_SCLFO|nr:beta-1,4-galactosyltransferase 4-like [Scleropages formosus]
MSRKGKYFLILLLSFFVLAWIANVASDFVRDAPSALWPLVLEQPEEGESHQPAHSHVLSSATLGSLPLSFPSSLTLKDVETKNSKVAEGKFEPEECRARQSVAVLIPHRNREKHLLYLLYHLHPFLQRQQLHYAIYVIHQAGNAMFNRAKLLNVGYLEALKDYSWDCFIFHDVDLLPENDHNLYMCEHYPKHLVVGRNVTGYKLRYKGYFGGVTAMRKEQFLKVNGFSNNYWGWGGEDDDLRVRVELQRMKILRPPPRVARYTMIFHKRDNGNEVNKDRMRLLGQTRKVWKNDGLNTCSYETLSVERAALYVNVTVDVGLPGS